MMQEKEAGGVEMHTVLIQEGVDYVEEIISQMTQFMKAKGVTRIEDFIGLTLKHLPKKPFSVWYQTPR
jgi:dihydroorotate dehydrogenase